jgi:hypothetical protein
MSFEDGNRYEIFLMVTFVHHSQSSKSGIKMYEIDRVGNNKKYCDPYFSVFIIRILSVVFFSYKRIENIKITVAFKL